MRQWLRRRRVSLILLVVCYAVFFMFGGCADKLVIFPSRGAMDAKGAGRREVPFEGGSLEILTARSPGAATRPVEAFVLRFGGNAERAEMNAMYYPAEWGDKPIEMWSVQYPGFGKSGGAAAMKRFAPAALAAFDAMAKEAGGKPIFLSATSLGTTLALFTAANRPVAGLVLRTPAPLQSLILRRHGWWNLWLLAGPVAWGVPGEMNAMKTAPMVNAPAIFVLIDTDEIIPLGYQQKVVEAYGGEKQVITSLGRDHNGPLSDGAYGETMDALDKLWARVVGHGR